ncbi:hypothetical protein H8B06_18705 [Sphingobacterium sp. DN00404]|uniref:Uncharacterized protein n=1 Tax=Sphingobacterium micropteri TaxID=2763501 RepID=A0ABR7YU32_9SPHI|nr:hypothetical protein [Sphingobacterium micropteri]MBD1434861.1 hypothetical protein [Sphingobacterium micropteri]
MTKESISKAEIFSAFSDRGQELRIKISPSNVLHKIRQKLGIDPDEHILHVKPLRLGTMGICSSFINDEIFAPYLRMNVVKAHAVFASKQLDDLFMALVSILWNREEMPPSWLVDFVKGLNQHDINQIVDMVRKSYRLEELSKYFHLNKQDSGNEDKNKRKPGTYKVNHWSFAGNIVKYWKLSYDEVYWKISYQNLLMLNASIPQYDDQGNKKEAPTQITGKDLSSRFKKKN